MVNGEKDCLDSVLSDIITELKGKNVAVLMGTGISKNSGNLTALDITYEILSCFKHDGNFIIEKDVRKVLMERTIQFEDFLNRIYDDVNVDKSIFSDLFHILYKGGKPNRNHLLIAWLLKEGYIKKVYTTNFDRHLEDAYKELGYEDLNTCILDPEGLAPSHDKIRRSQYIKLHGCLTKPNKIATLLTRVASKNNLQVIKSHIEELLIYGDHETVLVMGYSFSDAYDIIKVILEVNEKQKIESSKKILIISHENSENSAIYSNNNINGCQYELKTIEEYNSYAVSLSPPKRKIKFDNFKITILRLNTDFFIDYLMSKFCFTYSEQKKSESNEKSKGEIIEWFKNIPDYENYRKYIIAWRFNYEAGQEYSLLKDNRKCFFRDFKCLDGFYNKKNKIQRKALINALKCCEIISNNIKNEVDIEKKKQRDIINETHKAATLISLGEFIKAETLLESLKLKCNEIENEIWAQWFKLNVNGVRLYLEYYKLLMVNFSSNIEDLNALKKFIENNEKYYEQLKVYDSVYRNHIVNYKNLYLLASLKNHLGLKVNETYFTDSIKYYEDEGRVEYLAFVYMEYAKFLISNRKEDSYEDIKNYMESAKYLFENLGYKEYLRFCTI